MAEFFSCNPSLLSVIFDGRFGFGYFVGGPDRTGKQ
jgi:hypothetical protein